MFFRARRARETAEALAAVQEALEKLARSTAALDEAGKRAGKVLSDMQTVTARAEARLAELQDDPAPPKPAEPGEPAENPEQAAPDTSVQ